MVLPLLMAGATFASGVMGMLGSNSQAKAAKQAAQLAAANDARQAAMQQQMIDQLTQQSGLLNRNADQNSAEADLMMQLFGNSLSDQMASQNALRTRNAQNDFLSSDLQAYLRNIDAQNYADSGFVRDSMMQRQQQADAAAREQRAYELREIAANKNLRQEERDYAIKQLERERGIASSEREQEARDIAQYKDRQSLEYQDRYNRLTQDRAQAMSERQREVQRQDALLARSASMRDELARVLEGQGTLATPELYGVQDVEAEAARRGKVYTSAIDKLADRAISMGEADLIRRGMDGGGDANEQRAEVLARLAPAYQDALLRADTEAQGIIGGKNQLLNDKFAVLREARDRAIGETQMRTSAGLDLEASLNPIQSGIYDRDIGSAASYVPRSVSERGVQGPLDIQSALYDAMSSNTGLAEYLGVGSRQQTGTQASGINTSFIDPGYINPQLFAQMAGNSRGLASGALQAATGALSGALGGANAGRVTTNQANIAAQTGLGTARAQQSKGWGDLLSAGAGLLGQYGGGQLKPYTSYVPITNDAATYSSANPSLWRI